MAPLGKDRSTLAYVKDVRNTKMNCKCYKHCGFGVWEWQEKKNRIEAEQASLNAAELRATMRNRIEHEFRGKDLQPKKVPLSFKESFAVKDRDSGTSKTITIDLCDNCFCALVFNKGPRTYVSLKADVKTMMQKDWVSERVGFVVTGSIREKLTRVDGAEFDNLLEAQAFYKKNGNPMKFTREDMQLMCLPRTAGFRQCFRWLRSFFDKNVEYAPNDPELHQLPAIYTRTSLYRIFVRHVIETETADEHDVISEKSFMDVWRRCFPHVKITKFVAVCGKCNTCHWIYEREETFRGEKDLRAIKQFRTVHKTMIEMERNVYYEKRQLAKKHPSIYMSLIIDAIAQSHCQLPHKANKVTYAKKATQHIMGAKQHFFSKSFYRTYSHISSGTNLACHVLLREIERRQDYCLATGEPMPRTLFLQIDGCHDNTSKTFYALIEDLISDDVFDRIEVCRLPVGHTHEDIDALFGVLWRAMQNKTLMTPQAWARAAKQCFEQDYEAAAQEAYCMECNFMPWGGSVEELEDF